jgi:Bifunctional DNA primase/polymerase, N-terminal/Primase C terminal 2 (PriCT-2)/Family of unknown function (DUF5906)
MTALEQAFEKNVKLQAALKLTENYSVFPVPVGTKKSHKSAAHSGGRKWGATRDETEIRADWQRWPDANLGIPTGTLNGIFIVETDTRAGGHAHDGEESLAKLIAEHGPLPTTLMARSPSGSVHYYWLWPDDGGPDIKNCAGLIGPGIDVRGEGGMVVAPPSTRIGASYEWINWGAPVVPTAPRLLEKARAAARRAAASSSARRDDGETHCDLDRLEAALKELPNPPPEDEELEREMGLGRGWESWNKILMAIYAATGGTSVGLKLAKEWSAKCASLYPDNEANTEERWRKFGINPPTDIGAGWLFKLVWKVNPGWDRMSLDDFYFQLPSGKCIYVPLMDFWPASSVDDALPPVQITYVDGTGATKVKKIKPHVSLSQNRPLQQTTWQPGMPQIIENKLFTDEGVWVNRRGTRGFNFYKRPSLIPGDARLAGPWLDVVDLVVGDNRPHVVAWLAHRYEKPHEKINLALVIGGAPGIGKDSMIEPVKRAIDHHNFAEVDPPNMLRPYTKWLQAVVLRISEARDLGDVNRYTFYNTLKRYTASPPDVLIIEEKYEPAYPIANVVGLIITTNHKDGLYLKDDDRRCHVSWSDAKVEDIGVDFLDRYWRWLNAGGDAHVAAYLRDFDLSNFNPKAPPPKTEAFWEMVETGPASGSTWHASASLISASAFAMNFLTALTQHPRVLGVGRQNGAIFFFSSP